MKITITPDNVMQRNVVSSLTNTNCILYDDPQPDEENAATRIGEFDGGQMVKWKMSINLSIDCPAETEEDVPSFTEGTLYDDGVYGYYTRDYTIFSDTFHSTFRFNRDRMKDVVLCIFDNSPNVLEAFLRTLDGYECIEQEHR